MLYLGDYITGYATLSLKFSTKTAALVPTILAGSPVVSVYKTNDLTQSTAGVTLTVDFDGLTGLNNVLIDLGADVFYSTGSDYQIVITTGTVDGVSRVGEVLATFSIENKFNGNVASGSSAISTIASGQLLTTGTEVNDYTDTATKNGIYHEVSDAAGALEVYYEFDMGGNGIGTEISMWGRLFNNNDTIGVFAYNWAGASWDQIGTMPGSNSAVDVFATFNLLTRHTGTGANLGKARVRGYAASGLTSATLYIDQAFISYSVVAQSVGYANGAIWIDTASGTAGTELYINGVADNPVDSIANANTIDDTLILDRFELSPDSIITFTIDQEQQSFNGLGWVLALGGKELTGSHIHGATVSGVATTAGDEIHFIRCELEACSLGKSHLTGCGLVDTIALTEATTYTLETCYSKIAGAGSPVIDFGEALGNTSLNMRRYSGGIEIRNMGKAGTDTMSLEGNGALTINANCVGGNIAVRGDFSVTDNSGGAVTITYDDNTSGIQDILEDTSTILPAQITAVPDAVLAAGDIDTYSLEEAQKIILAASAGEVSGALTSSITIRAADDSKPRITAAVDGDGNRTSVIIDEVG